jgi:hypothetical protein
MIIPVKPNISLIDKSFREDFTRNFQLTIQLSLDGFSLAIYDPEKQRYIGYELYNFIGITSEAKLVSALDEVFLFRQWIIYPFQAVVVVVDHSTNTLVPSPLYDEKEKETYLLFNHPRQDNARVAGDLLKNADAYNVYYLSNVLAEKIKEYWANARIMHSTSVLTESLLLQHKNKPAEQQVFVHVRNHFFDIVVLRHEKMHFYNSFKFGTREDFIYFLLFSLEQLQLNPETIDLVFMGQIEVSSTIYDICWKYIRNIRFIERSSAIQYSYVLDDLPGHQQYVLLNALQCEL